MGIILIIFGLIVIFGSLGIAAYTDINNIQPNLGPSEWYLCGSLSSMIGTGLFIFGIMYV